MKTVKGFITEFDLKCLEDYPAAARDTVHKAHILGMSHGMQLVSEAILKSMINGELEQDLFALRMQHLVMQITEVIPKP